MPDAFHGLQPDDMLTLAVTSPMKRFTYTINGKKTYVAYALNAIDALELFEKASLDIVLNIDGVHEETEDEGRAWEAAACASMRDGRVTS